MYIVYVTDDANTKQLKI